MSTRHVAQLLSLLTALGASAQETADLTNAGFEQAGKGGLADFCKAGWQPETGDSLVGLADGWTAYQWGPADATWSVGVERGAGRNGSQAFRALNRDPRAQAGIYQHAKLSAGTWRLSVWVRAAAGKSGHCAIYLGNTYSAPYKVTGEWKEIHVDATIGEPLPAAEVNLQSRSTGGVAIWFDDAVIRKIKPTIFRLVPDDRAERPRTLLFSPINLNYLREHAADCAKWGFRGFLFDGVMASCATDVWAVDGHPETQGEGDGLLQELRACNDACRQVGIDSNFIKAAFYEKLPDWFDDAAWQTITDHFREGARLAKLSGCAGLAIDTEYMAEQFTPDWEGYKANPHTTAELMAKAQERWRAVTAAMLQQFPDMPLLTLPEGMLYYGELYGGIFKGFLQGCADADSKGGLHVMTEGTYHLTDPGGLAMYPARVDGWVADECAPALADYWKRRGTVMMGAWPLGYYREIHDKDGKFLGYSGKEAAFGDKVVGSYNDKSEWYTPEVFARQMAGINSFSPHYNWIYGHGDVFWQWTEAEQQHYLTGTHKSVGNATLPVVPNLQDYIAAILHPQRVVQDQ